MNKTQLFSILDKMTEALGEKETLFEVAKAISAFELQKIIEFINSQHGLNLITDEKVYLNDILDYYFDVQDLTPDKWQRDEEGFYTRDIEEVAWFKRLNQAFEHISDEELQTNVFNDYDEIIAFYEGKL